MKFFLLLLTFQILIAPFLYANVVEEEENSESISSLNRREVDSFVSSGKIVSVGFFSSKSSHEYITFKAVAETLPDELRETYLFAATMNRTKTLEFEANVPSVIVYSQHYPGKAIFPGPYTAEALSKFIYSSSFPLFGELDEKTFSAYMNRGIKMAYFIYSTIDDREEYVEFFQNIALKYQNDIAFVALNGTKFSNFAVNRLGVKNEWPGFAIERGSFKYPFNRDFTKKNLEQFIADVESGTEPWYVKSEDEPESNAPGGHKVIKVVGKTYLKVVEDKEKDVFILICAPGFPKCEALDPVWEKLAEYLEGLDIIIAKMDGSKNSIPPTSTFEVSKFPTLVLYKAESNDIVTFVEEPTIRNLYLFLKNNAINGKNMGEISDESQESKNDSVKTPSGENVEHEEL